MSMDLAKKTFSTQPDYLIAGTAERMQFLDDLERLSAAKAAPNRPAPQVTVDNIMAHRTFEPLAAGGLEGRTRAMLKVEDGCTNFCS